MKASRQSLEECNDPYFPRGKKPIPDKKRSAILKRVVLFFKSMKIYNFAFLTQMKTFLVITEDRAYP
jgi:hypothetical protein